MLLQEHFTNFVPYRTVSIKRPGLPFFSKISIKHTVQSEK